MDKAKLEINVQTLTDELEFLRRLYETVRVNIIFFELRSIM